jgi:hypothetical protein
MLGFDKQNANHKMVELSENSTDSTLVRRARYLPEVANYPENTHMSALKKCLN